MTKEKEIEIAIEIIENNSELINFPKYAKIVSIFKPKKLVNWLKDYKRLLLKDQGCETCKYQYTPIDDKFCKDCDGFSLWEAKDELNI